MLKHHMAIPDSASSVWLRQSYTSTVREVRADSGKFGEWVVNTDVPNFPASIRINTLATLERLFNLDLRPFACYCLLRQDIVPKYVYTYIICYNLTRRP